MKYLKQLHDIALRVINGVEPNDAAKPLFDELSKATKEAGNYLERGHHAFYYCGTLKMYTSGTALRLVDGVTGYDTVELDDVVRNMLGKKNSEVDCQVEISVSVFPKQEPKSNAKSAA